MSAWIESSIKVNREAADAVSEMLIKLGSEGFAIRDRMDFLNTVEYSADSLWELNEEDFPEGMALIQGYFDEDVNIEDLHLKIESEIKKMRDLGLVDKAYDITFERLAEEDYATSWQKYYSPIPVTRYLTIVPIWEKEEYELKPEEQALYLDPGLAFGTGKHATTALCIQALEIIMRGGETVFDVGTGSGVLSIAASIFGAESVEAFDVNDIAVESAKENIKLNELETAIPVSKNNLLEGVDRKADLIVANIIADIILDFSPDITNHLNDCGHLIASGIISERAEEVKEVLTQSGLTIIEVLEKEDWVAIIAKYERD